METQTFVQNGIRVTIDVATGEVLRIEDALTRQAARLFHTPAAIHAAVRYATESVLCTAELG